MSDRHELEQHGEPQVTETTKERLEREHGELLQELRSLIPGAEVLFGFLLAIRFTGEFRELDDTERYIYYVTLLCTALALVLYLAPAVYHRVRFREGDKEFMLRKANREALAGSVATALALSGALFLVTELVFSRAVAVVASLALFVVIAWRWWAIGLYRSFKNS